MTARGESSTRHTGGRRGQPRAAGGSADSAGRSWSGRTLPGGAFAGDTGAPEPELLDVLAAALADPRNLVAALASARLFVPVVATVGESAEAAGLALDAGAAMSVMTLTAPSGQRGLPVFSSVATLAAWRADARPVPVSSAHAAQAVIAEGCDVLLLDVGSPHARVLMTSMVWALAERRPWVPAHEDTMVRTAVEQAAALETAIAHCRLGPGPAEAPTTLTLTLAVVAGLDEPQVRELATRLAERLATDGAVRTRIDGVSFRVVVAAPEHQAVD